MKKILIIIVLNLIIINPSKADNITDFQIEERAYSFLFSRKYDEELENTLRSMRAEAFVEFKDLD